MDIALEPKASGRAANPHRGRFEVLDGLRGVAAMFVAVRHSAPFFGFTPFFRSYLAVDLFFILSGFVICGAYERPLRRGELSFASFMSARLARLWPAFVVSWAIAAALQFGALDYGATDSWRVGINLAVTSALSLFFLPFPMFHGVALGPGNGHVGDLFFLAGPYWSLFFELIVNAIYAFAILRLDGRRLALTVTAAFAVLCVGAVWRGDFDFGFNWGIEVFGGLARAAFGFFVGVALRRYAFAPAAGRFAAPWPAVVLAVGAVLASPSAGAFDPIVDLAIVGLLFPAIVLAGATAAPGRARAIMVALGAASYPLYVLHFPLAHLVYGFLRGPIVAHAPWSGFVFVGGLTALCAVAARRYEEPARKRLRAALAAWTG